MSISTPTGRFGPVRLHDEVAAILELHGNPWMTTAELAAEVILRHNYRREDGVVMLILLLVRNYIPSYKRPESPGSLMARHPPTSLTSDGATAWTSAP